MHIAMSNEPIAQPPPEPDDNAELAEPYLHRRDFIRLSVVAVAGYGLIKTGFAAGAGPKRLGRTLHTARLKVLGARQEAIVTRVALAITGPAAEAAYERGEWDPAYEIDGLLARLPEDQQKLLGIAIYLFENWNWGLKGFTRMPHERQAAYLAKWRTSSIALQRSTWGFLHAASVAAFSSLEAGWSVLDYPGPCVPSGKYTGRAPGQTALFEWDPGVP
jgi:hypothetical protein